MNLFKKKKPEEVKKPLCGYINHDYESNGRILVCRYCGNKVPISNKKDDFEAYIQEIYKK